jgi:hypothetical protein
MGNKELLRRVKSEIRRLTRSYYAQKGDAFCHYAVREYFDLDEDDAYEYCDIGGKNDKGLDAFWHDEAERRIVIVQARYSETGNARWTRELLTTSAATFSWLQRLGANPSRSANEQVKAAARKLNELREIDSSYPVEIYCICLGKVTPGAREEVAKINDDLADSSVTLYPVGLIELKAAVEERLSRDEAPFDDTVTIPFEHYFEYDPPDGHPRTVVAALDGIELARLERKYQHRIFQQNVRYYLKAGQKVNKSIAQTISSNEGREEFWYYNNGIAIVCDEYKLDDAAEAIELKNLQIVNGCQTTTTLGHHLDELEEGDSPVHVLCRIIESDNEELQRNITLYNNRQNAVRDRDLLSNDKHQDRLQIEFGELDPPWFYERKRGEWDAVVKPKANWKARYGKPARRVDNEAAAQAAYAFYFDPAEARARKKLLFVPADDIGFYDDIFNDDTSAEWLLVPFRIWQYVVEQKATYVKRLRQANPAKPLANDRRLLAREWVKFGDQMLVGTIGYFIRQRSDLDNTSLAALLSGEFDEMTKKVYVKAAQALNSHFQTVAREYKKRDEPFSPANYVKGHWSDVVETIADEFGTWEEEGIDIFDGIPELEAE